jgi:choline kinase
VTCLIIAAGRGSRLSTLGDSKPLVPLGDRSLIEWVIGAASRAGIRHVLGPVPGDDMDVVRFVSASESIRGLTVNFIHNDEWEKENGRSVARAVGHIRREFFLLMSDHVFDEAILRRLREAPLAEDEVILAVDTAVEGHPTVDMDDVTRVLVRDGRIVAIGKHLTEFNAFDTGIFRCTPAIFDALEESSRDGDHTLSGGMRVLAARGKARVLDIVGLPWIDVDDELAHGKARRLFVPPPGNGDGTPY